MEKSYKFTKGTDHYRTGDVIKSKNPNKLLQKYIKDGVVKEVTKKESVKK